MKDHTGIKKTLNHSIIRFVLRNSTAVLMAQDIWLTTVKIGVSLKKD